MTRGPNWSILRMGSRNAYYLVFSSSNILHSNVQLCVEQSRYREPVGGLPQVSQGFLHQADWKWPVMWLLEEMNKRLSRKAHMNLLDFFHGFSTSDIEGSSSLGIRNSADEVLHAHNLMICFSVSFSTSIFQGSSSLGTAHLLMEVLHAPKGLMVFD